MNKMDNSNIFTIAIATTIIYAIAGFIDMRFIRKEQPSVRDQVRSITLVFVSSVLAIYLVKSVGTDLIEEGGKTISAFTGAPGF